jgi:hypothetical protein
MWKINPKDNICTNSNMIIYTLHIEHVCDSGTTLWNLGIVRKYGPQNDHVERSDLAKRFFIAGWEREREGERGRGLTTPQ